MHRMRDDPLTRLRRLNLEIAIRVVADGNAAAFARLVKRAPQQITDMLGDRKAFGEKIARYIERAAGLAPGWLDLEHDDLAADSVHNESGTPRLVHAGAGSTAFLFVPLFDAQASMGRGRPLPEHDAVVDHLMLSRSWIRVQLPTVSSPDNLAVLTATGDSMRPTFDDGDLLVIDRGVTDIRVDAVYVLALRDELYVKRIQRRITDGAWIVRSDNNLYDPVVVSDGDADGLRVLGRVVWAWNGKRL